MPLNDKLKSNKEMPIFYAAKPSTALSRLPSQVEMTVGRPKHPNFWGDLLPYVEQQSVYNKALNQGAMWGGGNHLSGDREARGRQEARAHGATPANARSM